MPKNIRTRTTNGLDNFDISTQTGNTHANIAFIKTIISVSANYTKDSILQSTLCEHNNSTTKNEIDFLNNFDRFPNLNQQKKIHIPAPEIKTDKIIYCFENTIEPFVELEANEEVSWFICGGFDSDKFILTQNKLSFVNPVDYENPINFSKNNIYNVIIKAINSKNIENSKNFSIVVRNKIEQNEKINTNSNFFIDVDNNISMPNNTGFVSYLNVSLEKKNILWEIDESNDYELFEIVIFNENNYAIQFKQVKNDDFIRNFKIIVKATDHFNITELKTINITTIPITRFTINNQNYVLTNIDDVIYKLKNNGICNNNNNEIDTKSIYNNYFNEIDMKILYEHVIKMFITKGPLYLPPPSVINKLYFNIQKALDNDPNKSIHLIVFKETIDIVFKTKNTFIHNISLEKQIKNIRKKYKLATSEIANLKKKLIECAPSGSGGSANSLSGNVNITVKQFKPVIYYQAKFNLVLAWYMYLHDNADIIPSLHYVTIQYLKQFRTKKESYDKLIQLLDEKYLDLENDISTSENETSSSSENFSSSNSNDESAGKSSSDGETISSAEEEKSCDLSETSNQNTSSSSSHSSSSSSHSSCSSSSDSSSSSSSDSSCDDSFIDSSSEHSIDTDSENNFEENLNTPHFYHKNPFTNNFVFFISGSFTISEKKFNTKNKTNKIKIKKKRKKFKIKKTHKIKHIHSLGPLPGKQYTYDINGQWILFLPGAFEIKTKNFRKIFCRKRKKTQKHYHFCPFKKTYKNKFSYKK
tara:strand:+ start:5684 stop:7954 length:2271 start_codon:yes stop_codon:yes gene_type:complete